MRALAYVALVVGLLGSSLAEAQPRRGGGDGERRAGRGPAERREQIKKKIRALRAYTLTEELVIDEQTASRLFPTLARYDDETERLVQQRVELQRRLRRADTLRDPRAVERLIDEAVANHHAFWNLEEKRLDELRKILTPVQIARVLIVLPALERRIRNQLRRASLKQGERALDDADDEAPDDVEPAPRSRREAPLAPGAPRATRGSSSNAPGNTPPCDPRTQPCR